MLILHTQTLIEYTTRQNSGIQTLKNTSCKARALLNYTFLRLNPYLLLYMDKTLHMSNFSGKGSKKRSFRKVYQSLRRRRGVTLGQDL